jgi:rod shape-determining protein MreC
VFKLKNKSLIHVVVVASLILILASLIPNFRPTIVNTLRYPLVLSNLIRREIGGIIFYHRNFIQNERLKNEVSFLKNEINALNEFRLENKRLKNLLSFKEKTPYKVIAARVIARSADNWSSVIIIDKGRYNGIKRGMVVISYLGLIGRVAEAEESTSKIMLINDSDFAVSGVVQRSRQEGLVAGTLGRMLVMRYLPKDADIRESDMVITSGLTDLYPKGLIIGRVVDVGEEFSGLSLYAVIKPAVNLSDIEEVLVIVQ